MLNGIFLVHLSWHLISAVEAHDVSLHSSEQVLDVNLNAFRDELVQEHSLIDVVDAKLLEHSSQVSHIDELLFLALLLQKSDCIDNGSQEHLVLQQLGTDCGQNLLPRLIEGSRDTL